MKSWINRREFLSALTEFLILDNGATQFEGPLEFDPVAMKAAGNSEVDALLQCEYWQGWSV
jgi:hypothetical protein